MKLNEDILSFLSDFKSEDFNLNNSVIDAMQGDAGFRQYSRISGPSKSFILMDSPPSYAPIKPFIEIANYLNDIGLRAPKIYSYNTDKGYVLLEDFGKISGKDLLESFGNDTAKIKEFYRKTIDIICYLQDAFANFLVKNLPESSGPKINTPLLEFSNDMLLDELNVFLEWYIKLISKDSNVTAKSDNNRGYLDDSVIMLEFRHILSNLLDNRPKFSTSLVLRDYHVENMMILDENELSLTSIGLLDFQDALIGSPVYDLVSLLEDARIEVKRDLALEMVEYFAEKKSLDLIDVLREYHILGLQRNLRILGVFARKSLRDGDNRYLAYMDRMIHYVANDLSIKDVVGIDDIRVWLKKYAGIS